MACLALGLAMLTAVLNVYIRDVSRLLPHMLRLWMYLSPVIWEYTRISGDGAESLARLNPMYPVMASWTTAFGGRIGSEFSMVMGVLVFGAIALATLAIGFLVFIAREDDFAVGETNAIAIAVTDLSLSYTAMVDVPPTDNRPFSRGTTRRVVHALDGVNMTVNAGQS